MIFFVVFRTKPKTSFFRLPTYSRDAYVSTGSSLFLLTLRMLSLRFDKSPVKLTVELNTGCVALIDLYTVY